MKSRTLSLTSYIACLEICYNLWNLLLTWLFLLINMMTTTDNNSSSIINTDNSNNMFIANLNACVNSINNNSCDYFSFDMCLVSNYMNNQLIYYYIFNTISAAEQACFQQLIKQHKTFLEMLEWNNMFDNNNNKSDILKDFIISVIKNSDSDCSASLSDYKSIKINVLNILKLIYNNMIT